MAAKDKQRKTEYPSESDNGLILVGGQIRDARESNGMSAESLASALHMGVEQLRALESGQIDQLPEQVFVRAMVRRLASHLRLDADSMVDQLGAAPLRQATPLIRTASPPRKTGRLQQSFRKPATSTRWILPGLILSGGAGLLIWQLQAGQVFRKVEGPSQQQAIEIEPESIKTTPIKAAEPSPQKLTVKISSPEPSWIALRREGTIEFQGTLDEPRTIVDPASVEIYAGRPDLVIVNVSDQQPRSVGAIHEVGWRRLIPEQ